MGGKVEWRDCKLLIFKFLVKASRCKTPKAAVHFAQQPLIGAD